MKYDEERIEELVLALLGVFEFDGGRAWKGYDFDLMDALHAEGFIAEPKERSKFVYLAEEGMVLAKRLAAKRFGKG